MMKGARLSRAPFSFRERHATISRPMMRHVLMVSVLLAFVVACSSDEGTDLPTSTSPPSGTLEGVSEEARAASGTGEPRSPGYWITWSSCGEDSHAETAAANGGREAGWVILDDLLDDPGVGLGGHPVSSCEEGVAILSADESEVANGLPRQLLTAELNLNVGSEHCAAIDETVIVANGLLASIGYAGPGESIDSLDQDSVSSMERVTELLGLYNSGVLCR
jgi:hypothetical protein